MCDLMLCSVVVEWCVRAVLWHGVLWHGVVWYVGAVWCGVEWSDMSIYSIMYIVV